MTTYSSNYNLGDGILVVQDPAQLLGFHTLLLASMALTVVFVITGASQLTSSFYEAAVWLSAGVCCFFVCKVLYLMIRSRNNGYVIDLNEGTLEFSAIGDPNQIDDYFNFTYWSRLISRRKIKLSDILNASVMEIRGENPNHSSVYILYLAGVFGSTELSFKTEGKRDQLYAYLRSINRMGIPIIN